MQVSKFLLPFAVSSKNRVEAFTEEMEIATIFCLAESERKKGRRLILKKPAEELLFLTEAYYPLLLIPWEKKAVLIDGLGIVSHTISYDLLPDVKHFISDTEESKEPREAYFASLTKNANYFHSFVGKEERKIDGLIVNPDLLSFIPEAQEIKEVTSNKAHLIPTFDEASAYSAVQELTDLKIALKEEFDDLYRSMKLLSSVTQRHVKNIKNEIKKMQKEYQSKITNFKASVKEKLHEIKKKYDGEIVTVSKLYNEKLQTLHQERAKLDNTIQNMRLNTERFEAEINTSKLQRNNSSELHWRQEHEKVKKELLSTQKSVKDLDERIREVEASKTQEIAKYTSEYNYQTQNAMSEVNELEASRDAKIQIKQQEIKSLEGMVVKIIDQISKLATQKETAIDELNNLCINRVGQKYVIVYLPFYLVCYRVESNKRYVIYSPSIAESIGISTRFKGLFKSATVKMLLEQRSKGLTNFLNQLIPVLESNPVFEKDVDDAGLNANMLQSKDSKEKISKGMEDLKNEGWLSENEFAAFQNALAKA